MRALPRRCRTTLAALVLLLPGLAACAAKGTVAQQEQPPPPLAPLRAEVPELPPRLLPPTGAKQTPAPLGLTATDGTGLRLVEMKARAVVAEPLAFTELHLVFDNPEDRTIEGHFTIDLPPGSAISRFAMKIDSDWQEGEVVERQAARVAYEDFLHRRQDPALLENQAGNRFSARVFPIPPRGRKELVLSYSQALPDSRVPYQLMLAGLPKLDHLDVEIIVDTPHDTTGPATSIGGVASTRKVITLDERAFTPTEDLAVASDRAQRAVGLRHDGLAVARVSPAGDMARDDIDDLTILFDTSASRALDFDGQIRRLGELVAELRSARDGDFPLRILAFDQDVSIVFDGHASGFGIDAQNALYSRGAYGASDLEGALRSLAAQGGGARVVVFTDGIATAGRSEAIALGDATRALHDLGVPRLDVIVDGGLQDRAVLGAMVAAGLPRDGVVIDGRLAPSEIAAKLRRQTLPAVEVTVPGATFVWPRTLRGMQSGDEVLVYAELPADLGMTVVFEGDEHRETDVALTRAEQPLLARALAGARIDALTLARSELGEDAITPRKRLQDQIVALSTKHRVLSDFTALLVLETEDDYRRFSIDRNALADILTVDARGVALTKRSKPTGIVAAAGDPPIEAPVTEDAGGVIPQMARNFDPEATPPAGLSSGHFLASPYGSAFAVGNDDQDVWGGLTGTEIGEAYGVGGLGLVGTGRGGGGGGDERGLIGIGGGGGSGYGRGSGAGFGGRGHVLPQVRQAKAKITGALDKDIVRRIVRAHINEIRHCYNLGLVALPTLKGRVTVQFAIGGDGRVVAAVVEESSLPDARVAQCMAKAVKRWKFPKPSDRGNAVVSYPFVLEPGTPPTPEELAQRERDQRAARLRYDEEQRRQAEIARTADSPYDGRMFDVMKLVDEGRLHEAVVAAGRWHDASPGDVLALLALGEALERQGKARTAARVYGSLIDLFPSRADLRRYAGGRLARLGDHGRRLAIDTYRQAVAQRPDHPNGHRLYAWALVRDGRLDEALDAILVGAERRYPDRRFEGVDRILREDAGLIAAALLRREPAIATTMLPRLFAAGATLPSGPSTRFVMSWETDANDVDFHVYDAAGGHAYYASRTLPSGGSLYADVTTGYGPECFTIEGTPSAFPYRIEANYFSRGPMGYGMGALQILAYDGEGGFAFDDRSFVIMKDQAFVKLGELTAPLVVDPAA